MNATLMGILIGIGIVAIGIVVLLIWKKFYEKSIRRKLEILIESEENDDKRQDIIKKAEEVIKKNEEAIKNAKDLINNLSI